MNPRIWHSAYEAGVPVDISFEDVALPDYLSRSAARFGGRPALIFGNRRITYQRLEDEVARFAARLTELGATPNTRVAIQMPNLPQSVIAFYGASEWAPRSS